jgi:ATP-dependent DNA ligase
LLQRIHPAASRIEKLSHQTPAQLIVFDLLVDQVGSALLSLPLQRRRKALEAFYAKYLVKNKNVELSLATHDLSVAQRWLETMRGQLDGISRRGSTSLIYPVSEPCLRSKRFDRPIVS